MIKSRRMCALFCVLLALGLVPAKAIGQEGKREITGFQQRPCWMWPSSAVDAIARTSRLNAVAVGRRLRS